MAKRKSDDSKTVIPQSTFNTCVLDGLTLADICGLYTREDIRPNAKNPIAYKLDKLIHHLKIQHQITMIDYCEQHLKMTWPVCPIKGTKVGFRVAGSGLILSTYARGAIDINLPANQAFYKRIAEERKGEGNPMHGRTGWNKGLTTETDPRMAALTAAHQEYLDNRTPEQLEAASQRGKEHYQRMNGRFHHSMPHSEETKEKCRLNTARLWAEGAFKRTSKIHLKMRAFLETLQLTEPFVEEHQVAFFSMDFAFPKAKVAIEVQGSYYHVDPRFYPNGPENAMQRRNWGRDIAKRKVCCDQCGWTIIEAWEPEINDGSFQSDILCKLKQYGLSSQ